MKVPLLAALLAASGAMAFDVPSGQPLELHEVLVDKTQSATRLRFRFVAPDIARDGGSITYDVAEPDMVHLCETTAIPYLEEYGIAGDQVVISLSDRITEFGKANPQATQYFEAYRVENGTCIWEEF